MAVEARYFLGGQGFSARFADFVPRKMKYVAIIAACPSRKYLASTAIYRLYTFCCQFARAFFRISDKKFFRFKSSSPPLPPSVFSTAEMKLFHEKLS